MSYNAEATKSNPYNQRSQTLPFEALFPRVIKTKINQISVSYV